MAKRQLFLFSLVLVLIVGNGGGIATMLPIYFTQLGAVPSQIGVLFSILYLGLSAAGILGGWLSDRLRKRKWLCITSAAGQILVALVLVTARSLALLSGALFVAWFLAGIHSSLVYGLVGLQADQKERGQVFGLLGFMVGFGPIVSGFLYGPIVDRFGFPTLFTINVAISILWTGLALFYKEPPGSTEQVGMAPPQALPGALGGVFILLLLASTLVWVTINGGKLGITLVMNRLEYSAGEISFTTGVSSAVVLAMPLLLGWLSDHIGRKPILLALNLLGAGGLLALHGMYTLFGFTLAASLLAMYGCFSGLANALTADLVPRQALGLGLSLISSSSNIAGIFSSSLLGLAFEHLGMNVTFLAALALPAVAALLLAWIPAGRGAPGKAGRPRVATVLK